MSSSKIIKSNRAQELRVCSVSYGGLSSADSGGTASAVPPPSGGFLPLHFKESTAGQIAPEEHAGPPTPLEQPMPEPGMVIIAEEELQGKIEAAFHKGVDEGRQQAERGLANVFRALREGVDEISHLREKVLRDSEGDLLKLAIMVARKIIQQEIKHDPQILANIVAESISCCSDLDRLTIRLNPDDCSRVSENRHFYLSGISANAQVSLIPDDSILPGGCMVDTVTGTIDARIEVQLDEIYRRFLETRGLPDGEASATLEEGTP